MITSDQYFVTGRYSGLINRSSGQAALVGRNTHCVRWGRFRARPGEHTGGGKCASFVVLLRSRALSHIDRRNTYKRYSVRGCALSPITAMHCSGHEEKVSH
eukprot:6658149-Alexandrium_andersonii.AAC.1